MSTISEYPNNVLYDPESLWPTNIYNGPTIILIAQQQFLWANNIFFSQLICAMSW